MIVMMMSPLWVMPLSTPVMADVVVVMHRDSAVNTAVRTITENVPDVWVVEYGSLDYALTIHRAFGRVVWVSHGSEEGILTQSRMLSWKAFSSRTAMTPGKDIVLACESGNINKYVSPTIAVGFDGLVDATLGALIATFLLRPTEATLSGMVFTQISRLLKGETRLHLLAPFTIQISYYPWPSATIRGNTLSFMLHACLALGIGVFGTTWDAIGILLDCIDIGFGNGLLNWIWPVLIKPALQVFCTAILGGLAVSLIGTLVTAVISSLDMYVLTFLSSLITYAIGLLLPHILSLIGLGNIMPLVNAVLIPLISTYVSGPLSRALALRLGKLTMTADMALSKIGVSEWVSIVIGVLEYVIDTFSYAYAPCCTFELVV